MLNDRIYVYERDGGNLVYQQQGSRSVHVRATELVIGFLSSLGNYAYAFNWVFREDGSFAFEVELSGGVSTRFVRDQDCGACAAIAQGPGPNGESRTTESSAGDRYGGLVHPGVVGLNHQHWFNLRLDFDVDGAANAVVENNVKRAARGSGSGGGGANEAAADEPAFTVARTVFGRSVEAKRAMNHDTARTWTIYNPKAADGRSRAPGYQIMPMENTATTFPRTRQRDPSGFTQQHLWVTPYRDGQLYAAGAYPNQAKQTYTDTLAAYADNSSIYDQDIVVWYSLGSTHVPRPEDFPLMPSKKLSVVFHPDGFFERNPLFGRSDAPTRPSPGAPP
jgi:primary-amine oxidase